MRHAGIEVEGLVREFKHGPRAVDGIHRRLRLAAPNRLGILFGYAFAALARAVFVGLLLFGVAMASGMQIDGDGVDLFGLVCSR